MNRTSQSVQGSSASAAFDFDFSTRHFRARDDDYFQGEGCSNDKSPNLRKAHSIILSWECVRFVFTTIVCVFDTPTCHIHVSASHTFLFPVVRQRGRQKGNVRMRPSYSLACGYAPQGPQHFNEAEPGNKTWRGGLFFHHDALALEEYTACAV